MEAKQFILKTEAVPVLIDAEEMELKEMNAAQRDRYLDSLSNRMRLDTAGRPAGVKKFDGLQSGLIALCLRRKDGSLVPEQTIQTWPASVVSGLFEMAQEINHLNNVVNGEVEPKNG